jgi:ABC-2 type transport system ATP-binding protein
VIVSVDNLTHRYGKRTALDGLTFGVEEGSLFGLLGPNGGGKSTLFRILATMMAPTAGRVSVAGHDVDREPDQVRREIGVVFQNASLDVKLTVDENLTGQGHLYGLSGRGLRARIDDALDRLGLATRRGDIVQTLSGGLRRRVEVAKALLHRPRVLLMDEPSTGLDPGARRELADYITDLRGREGMTVLLTTHILDEADRCDHLLLLHEGRRVTEGSPAELKARVGGDIVMLEVRDFEETCRQIGERFGVTVHHVDGTLRIEIGDGHRFVTEVVEAFPGAIESVALHKPTLEDVFLDETGVSISA